MEQFRNLRTRGSKLHECYELKDSIKGFCLLRHGPLKRSEREHFFRFERARNMWRARVEKKKEGATPSPCPSFSPLHSIHLHILLRQSSSFSRRRSLFLCFSVLFHLSHSLSLLFPYPLGRCSDYSSLLPVPFSPNFLGTRNNEASNRRNPARGSGSSDIWTTKVREKCTFWCLRYLGSTKRCLIAHGYIRMGNCPFLIWPLPLNCMIRGKCKRLITNHNNDACSRFYF